MSVRGPVKAPTGSYPKLWRLIDQYFLKDEHPDRDNVSALELICEVNAKVLANDKSVNARTIRARDISVVLNTGAVEVLVECGWNYRVQRMEESYVLPFDADLADLAEKQAKLDEALNRVRDKFVTQEKAVRQAKAQQDAERLRIIKQIDDDRAERQYKQALKSGIQNAPRTVSLDEQRKQAILERMERERRKKERLAAEQQQLGSETVVPEESTERHEPIQQHARVPGAFPASMTPLEHRVSPHNSRRPQRQKPRPTYEGGSHSLGGQALDPEEVHHDAQTADEDEGDYPPSDDSYVD
ncbi:hypothetical protein PYCC9005_004639 [Savitreella phatthalungensis]